MAAGSGGVGKEWSPGAGKPPCHSAPYAVFTALAGAKSSHRGLVPCRVTLGGAQGLVCRREASPTAAQDRRGRGRARCIKVVWSDLVRSPRQRLERPGDRARRSQDNTSRAERVQRKSLRRPFPRTGYRRWAVGSSMAHRADTIVVHADPALGRSCALAGSHAMVMVSPRANGQKGSGASMSPSRARLPAHPPWQGQS